MQWCIHCGSTVGMRCCNLHMWSRLLIFRRKPASSFGWSTWESLPAWERSSNVEKAIMTKFGIKKGFLKQILLHGSLRLKCECGDIKTLIISAIRALLLYLFFSRPRKEHIKAGTLLLAWLVAQLFFFLNDGFLKFTNICL